MEGEHPTSLFTDKHGDQEVVAQVMTQYNTTRGAHGLRVDMINDRVVRFGVQLLARKLLCNNQPNEVSVRCIPVATKCAMEVTMSWAHFLADEFKVDYLQAHEKRGHFIYSWLLIPIALIGWHEPQDSSFIE